MCGSNQSKVTSPTRNQPLSAKENTPPKAIPNSNRLPELQKPSDEELKKMNLPQIDSYH